MSTNQANPAPTFGVPNNNGPVANVLAWLGLVVSALAILARMGTKWVVQRKIEWDDGAIMAAFLAAVGQTVAVSFAVSDGLGSHIHDLDPSRIIGFQKSIFAGGILFIVSLCFVKISVTLIVHFLKPFLINRKLCMAIGAVTVIWTVISIFLAALQCSIPEPWNFVDNKCMDRAGYWTFINVSSIVLDAALVFTPIIVLRDLQVALQRKILLMAVFCSRILVIGATLALIVLTIRQTPAADPTFAFIPMTLASTITMNLSIITACFPYLKPFLESLESGMIRSDDLFRRRPGVKTRYGRGYSLGPTANANSRMGKASTNISSKSDGLRNTGAADKTLSSQERLEAASTGGLEGLSRERWGIVGPFENLTSVSADKREQRDADLESQSSQSRIITRTTTWMVSRDGTGE